MRVSAQTLVETSLIYSGRHRRATGREVPDLITELGVVVIPFGEAEWPRAAEAFRRYGRGRHRAALNFGDCLAYARASVAGDSLLFVGDGFHHTDLRAAL